MSSKNALMTIALGSLLLGFYLAVFVDNIQVRFVVILLTGMVSGWSLRAWWMTGLWEQMNEWRFMAHRRRHVIESYEKEIQRLGGNVMNIDSDPCNETKCGDPPDWDW